jgi:hypothetical protein
MPFVFIHNFAKTIKISPARKNKAITVLTALSLLFNIAAWLLLIIKFQQIIPTGSAGIVPLHYNVYLGIDLQNAWWHSLFMPLIGLLFLILNYLLALALFHKKDLISYFLVAANLLLQITICGASIFTLLLNI